MDAHEEIAQKSENIWFQLHKRAQKEDFKGYDPYDGLTGWIPFQRLGTYPAAIATQILKRLPFQTRPILGIKKQLNPKALALMLEAFSLRYLRTNDKVWLTRSQEIFSRLAALKSKGYKGAGWGYPFGWASSVKYLPPYTPTAVVTGFVNRGIVAYYLASGDKKALELIREMAVFVREHLYVTRFGEGIVISYSPNLPDNCFNASLLAAEILAANYAFCHDTAAETSAREAVEYAISRQHDDGHWDYSISLSTGEPRVQIDFHQGYVIDSIDLIAGWLRAKPTGWRVAIQKGLKFYQRELFDTNGRARWRWPAAYPTDIHCQAQGIISFSRFAEGDNFFTDMAFNCADWAIENLYNQKQHYFYFRKYRLHKNKLNYFRWGQAWMFLALEKLQWLGKIRSIHPSGKS